MADSRPGSDAPAGKPPLWLWPGVVAVGLQWLAWLVVPTIAPGSTTNIIGVASGFIGGLAVVVWWAFFSRAPRSERWGAVVLMIVAVVVTPRILSRVRRGGEPGSSVLYLRRSDPEPRLRRLGGGQPSPR